MGKHSYMDICLMKHATTGGWPRAPSQRSLGKERRRLCHTPIEAFEIPSSQPHWATFYGQVDFTIKTIKSTHIVVAAIVKMFKTWALIIIHSTLFATLAAPTNNYASLYASLFQNVDAAYIGPWMSANDTINVTIAFNFYAIIGLVGLI